MVSKWLWLIKEWLRVWAWYPWSVYKQLFVLLDGQKSYRKKIGIVTRLWCLKGALIIQWTATLYYLSVAYEDKHWLASHSHKEAA